MKLLALAAVFALVCSLTSEEILKGKSISKQQDRKVEWWQSAVFYQIYSRSFKDTNNDGIGDIRGVIEKLPHLAETGITAFWLSSVLQSPQVDFGYDVSDFNKVDEIFGSNEDLYELFRKAKDLGIKVIMDFVPNHTSNKHEWFEKSVAREKGFENFYVWHDGYPSMNGGRPLRPNNWLSVFSNSAWRWNEVRQQYYLHQFTPQQPDLNFREPRVVQAMKDVLTFWMDQGADGFRVDDINFIFEDPAMRNEPESGLTTEENDYNFLNHIYTVDSERNYELVQEFREHIDAYNKAKGGDTRAMFSQAYTSIDNNVRYYADEQGNPRAHFPFNGFLMADLNVESTAKDFKQTIDKWMSLMPAGATPNWVLGNHDQARFGSRYGVERIDGMLTLLLTLPGVAVTYNGDEIGMLDYREISWDDTQDPQACSTNDPDNYQFTSRDPVRTPYQWDDSVFAGFSDAGGRDPWLPVNPNYQTLNLAQQKAAPKSFYKFYQQLALLRRNDTFVYGDFKSTAVDDNVFGYVRSLSGEATYVVLINFSDKEVVVDVNSLGVNFKDDSEIVLAGSKSNYAAGALVKTLEFKLAAYDAIILTDSSSAIAIKASVVVLIVGILRHFI